MTVLLVGEDTIESHNILDARVVSLSIYGSSCVVKVKCPNGKTVDEKTVARTFDTLQDATRFMTETLGF